MSSHPEQMPTTGPDNRELEDVESSIENNKEGLEMLNMDAAASRLIKGESP